LRIGVGPEDAARDRIECRSVGTIRVFEAAVRVSEELGGDPLLVDDRLLVSD
jgi:hypothetical protein